jgi:hypothetical protein
MDSGKKAREDGFLISQRKHSKKKEDWPDEQLMDKAKRWLMMWNNKHGKLGVALPALGKKKKKHEPRLACTCSR